MENYHLKTQFSVFKMWFKCCSTHMKILWVYEIIISEKKLKLFLMLFWVTNWRDALIMCSRPYIFHRKFWAHMWSSQKEWKFSGGLVRSEHYLHLSTDSGYNYCSWDILLHLRTGELPSSTPTLVRGSLIN